MFFGSFKGSAAAAGFDATSRVTGAAAGLGAAVTLGAGVTTASSLAGSPAHAATSAVSVKNSPGQPPHSHIASP